MAREREFEIEDNRSTLHTSGNRTTLKMPGGLSMWIPKKAGVYRVEFIPFLATQAHTRFRPDYQFSKPGRWYYERTYFAHFNVGIDNGAYTCPLKTIGKSCPICEERARLMKSPHKDDNKRGDELKPKERQLFLVILRDDRGNLDDEIKLWDVSNWNFGKLLQEYIDAADEEDRAAFKVFYHPKNGYTVKLNATEETTGSNSYLKFHVHEFKARREPLPLEVFDHGYDLDDMVRVLDYDGLRMVFHGEDDDPPADKGSARDSKDSWDSGDENPKQSKNGSPWGRKKAPEPDEDPPAPPANRLPAEKPVKEVPKESPKEEPPPLQFATRDEVAFNEGDEVVTGIIESISVERQTAKVKVRGRDKPMTVGFDELRLVSADDTFDLHGKGKEEPKVEPAKEEPVKKAAKGKWADAGDDDEDSRSKPAEKPSKSKK